MDKNNETDVQQKYMELQMLTQQMQQVQKQLQTLSMQDLEIKYIIQSVSSLDDTKEGSDLLAPIANGIFMRAKLEDKKNLLVNVGADIITEKSVPETVKMLSRQVEEVNNVHHELTTELTKMREKSRKLEIELNEILTPK